MFLKRKKLKQVQIKKKLVSCYSRKQQKKAAKEFNSLLSTSLSESVGMKIGYHENRGPNSDGITASEDVFAHLLQG